jgi:Mg2+ and Co2+ transporter CorA
MVAGAAADEVLGLTARFVEDGRLLPISPDQIAERLGPGGGFLWLDVDAWTPAVDDLLTAHLNLHPVARDYARVRNHMPMVHGYRDHLFLVLHRPVVLRAGETEMVELDVFLGRRFVVTVQKRNADRIGGIEAVSEIDETLDRIAGGRVRPDTPVELVHAVVSLMALRQRLLVQDVAIRVADLEHRALRGRLNDPEQSLDEMFLVRYELLSVRTTAAHNEEVLGRARRLEAVADGHKEPRLADLQDMFRRVHRMTDSEQELLAGVIGLFRARTDTKMTVASERLAVLAAVTLPVTAISSVYGVNVIVNGQTQVVQLVIVLVVMAVISGLLLRWTKKQGWW